MSERLVIIGAGAMGRGIAQVAATSGFDTWLVEVDEDRLEAAIIDIERSFDSAVGKGRLDPGARADARARLSFGINFESVVPEADVVIEAVPEKLELKQRLFRRLGQITRPDALLATNTSSLSVTRIAEGVVAPERVLGLHFFNPPTVLTLLEMVRGKATSEAAIARARELGVRLGREIILVQDSPGFATSRLGVALGLEAIRMLEEGVASAEDIDRAMVLGYRHPMGPLRLTDLVGLDTRLLIAEHLHRELGGDRFRPPALLARMVAEGKLGKKTGEGFYRW
jgi:3-hydroxybutyryl-CoA dehydrogenase